MLSASNGHARLMYCCCKARVMRRSNCEANALGCMSLRRLTRSARLYESAMTHQVCDVREWTQKRGVLTRSGHGCMSLRGQRTGLDMCFTALTCASPLCATSVH